MRSQQETGHCKVTQNVSHASLSLKDVSLLDVFGKLRGGKGGWASAWWRSTEESIQVGRQGLIWAL